jgi:DNA-binding NarL/FixJ family response regulator
LAVQKERVWMLVDPQACIREALSIALTTTTSMEVVSAGSLAEMRQHMTEHKLEGALIGYSPSLGRWDELHSLVAAWSLRAVLLDERLNELNLHQVLLSQWAGYLTKEQSLSEIIAGMQEVSTGARVLAPSARQRVVMTAQGPRLRIDRPTSVLSRISKRELDVLLLVAQGYSVRETADLLGVKASTIENHKTRMMRKLHVHKSVDLTRIALQEGLLSHVPPTPRKATDESNAVASTGDDAAENIAS